MRNIPKPFSFGSNKNKFVLARLNPKGFNSAIRLNFFFTPSLPAQGKLNAMYVPIFDTKSLYSGFSYKYFSSKFQKFEQKITYLKYFKFPDLFPKFTKNFTLFSNLVIKKRRVRKKKKKFRIVIKLKNQPFHNARSILKFYRFPPFSKVFRFYKKLDYFFVKKCSFRALAYKKIARAIFPKLWRPRRFYRKNPFSRRKLYFSRRNLAYRVFKLFKYKKLSKKIKSARRFAYYQVFYHKFFTRTLFPDLKKFNFLSSQKKIIRNKRFLKRFVKKAISYKLRKGYKKPKSTFKVIFRASFYIFGNKKFSGFAKFLLFRFFYFSNLSGKTQIFNSFTKRFFIRQAKIKFFLANTKKINSKVFKNFRINLEFQNFLINFGLLKSFSVGDNFFNFLPFSFNPKFTNRGTKAKFKTLQAIQKRRMIQNFRLIVYFFVFSKALQFTRSSRLYHKIRRKFIKLFFFNSINGQSSFILPFIFNSFFYFGLLSHVNSNLYFYDPSKFNQFYAFKNKRKTLILKNNF